MNKKNQSIDQYYTDISSTIDKSKHSVQRAVNDAMVMLYWTMSSRIIKLLRHCRNNKPGR